MSESLRSTQSPPSDQQVARAQRARWWLWLVIGVIAPLTLLAAAILAVLAYFQAENARAAAAVRAEVARIQAAGEPITTADLYAYHRVPAGVPDLTQEWLAVLASFDEKKSRVDATNLPIVDTGDRATLDPRSPESRFEEANQFLHKYDATIQAAIAVAKKPGECRFPSEFEKGITMESSYCFQFRVLRNFLQLNLRVRAYEHDLNAAVDSAEAILGISRAMQHQLSVHEQLQGIAAIYAARYEIEFLLNQVELSDDQLARLLARVSPIDAQSGLRNGIFGDRAAGYYIFTGWSSPTSRHASAPPKPEQSIEALVRPVDCQLYLELMREAVAATRDPFPQAQNAADKVGKRFSAVGEEQNPLKKMKYLTTNLIAPNVRALFQAEARKMGNRNLLLAALAAERHRLRTGSYPASLADLVPEFLPDVPVDPFDGKPLRMVAGKKALTLYSVGEDRHDDGGLDKKETGRPDIVMTLRAKKGAGDKP